MILIVAKKFNWCINIFVFPIRVCNKRSNVISSVAVGTAMRTNNKLAHINADVNKLF